MHSCGGAETDSERISGPVEAEDSNGCSGGYRAHSCGECFGCFERFESDFAGPGRDAGYGSEIACRSLPGNGCGSSITATLLTGRYRDFEVEVFGSAEVPTSRRILKRRQMAPDGTPENFADRDLSRIQSLTFIHARRRSTATSQGEQLANSMLRTTCVFHRHALASAEPRRRRFVPIDCRRRKGLRERNCTF